jgi:predicted protein tyrosine phosphatase
MKNFIKILGKKVSVEEDIHSQSQQKIHRLHQNTSRGICLKTSEDSIYAALQLCQLSKNPKNVLLTCEITKVPETIDSIRISGGSLKK